jgi:hypothetical protein
MVTSFEIAQIEHYLGTMGNTATKRKKHLKIIFKTRIDQYNINDAV